VEFLLGGEELGTAAHAVVGTFALLLELLINLAEGTLGAASARHFILFEREEFLPVVFGFHNFGLGHGFGVGFGFVLGMGDAGCDDEGGKEGKAEFHGVGGC
jgi:hypothetical protein